VLRPATDDDADFARRTHHDAFRDVVTRQFGGWDLAQQDRFFDDGWDAAAFEIVEVDGEAVGYVQIADDPEALKVKNIVLAPQFQNRGIGTNLMRDVIERARAANKPVWLGVLFENHRARALYERLGFRDIGSTDTHHLMSVE